MIKILNGKYIAEEILDDIQELHEDYGEELEIFKYHSYDQAVEEIKNGNLDMLFLLIERRMRLECFISIFYYIDDESKYEFFVETYSDVERGFELIPGEIIDEIRKLRPKEVTDKLNTLSDVEGYLIIYRGNCTKSTPVEQAISWTTDPKVAQFFANRFNKGEVYKAKVKADKVITYISSRNESEVLVNFKDIQLI